MENSDTLNVLKKLERGEINSDQAEAQLNPPPVIEKMETPPFDRMQMPGWVQRIGYWTLFGGVLTVVLGAWIIMGTYRTNVFLFLIGLAIVLWGTLLTALGAGTFTGHWIYINIDRSHQHKNSIRFGVPFPISLLRIGLWFMQFAPRRASARVNVSADRVKFNALWQDPEEFVNALERELKEGRGITIDVDEKDERVQVYIV